MASRLVVLLMVVLLGGCGPRYERAVACKRELGPDPGAGLGLAFGLGAVLIAAIPSHPDWGDRMNACMARRKLADQKGV
jgi:hypothetical protein